MITINPMPPQAPKSLLDALGPVASNDVGHVRCWGIMDPAIRPVITGSRALGTAITVIAPGLDSAMIPHVLGMARAGDILVIDRLGDRTNACLGSVVALAARVAGLAGIIIDGMATDFEEMRELGLPVWCRGQAASMTKLHAISGAINVPISCGGVAVLPGDVVLADKFGVCVLAKEDVVETASRIAIAAQQRPRRIEAIKAGEKLGDLNGVSAKITAQIVG